jgi:5'-methylthioadenosine phosphorylase
MSKNQSVLGIIGGTGLYQLEGIEISEKKTVVTPFGSPSSPIHMGQYKNGRKVAFLPRHGEHHNILPSEINFRANIWALKSVGVRQILSVSAVGSLIEEIAPGQLALPNQYLDWTKGKRNPTFFGDGVVAHISTAQPTCVELSRDLVQIAKAQNTVLHTEKTYACVEGPRLGSRAESFFLKSAGCHVVGMTNVPESFLAREAQLCYVTLAVATDYDCWKEDPNHHVSVDQVIALYKKSLGKVQALLKGLLELDHGSGGPRTCACSSALKDAFLTPPDHIPPQKREMIEFLTRV